MPIDLAQKVAVVTGASSGIGWALARELGRQKCKVGLIARRLDKLQELASALQMCGTAVAIAQADVGVRAQQLAAVDEIRQALGPIDLFIANAGVGTPTVLDPPNTSDVEQMLRVNTLGLIYGVEAVLPEMLRRRRGHIAAISSLAGYRGLPGESGYCASKAAVNCYMEGLRVQLRGRGIAITTVCPGFVRTAMTDVFDFHMPWLLEADDAARKIVRALRRHRKVYNFPWQTALLMKITGWLPDWLLARTMKSYNEKTPLVPLA